MAVTCCLSHRAVDPGHTHLHACTHLMPRPGHTPQAVTPTAGCVLVSGQFLGSWPWTAVTVVVVLSVMVILSAVIVWFVLSR